MQLALSRADLSGQGDQISKSSLAIPILGAFDVDDDSYLSVCRDGRAA
jgi:hypothetical protein